MNLARNTWRRISWPNSLSQVFDLRRGVNAPDLRTTDGATVSELRELLAELEDRGFGEMRLTYSCARDDTYYPIEALYLDGSDDTVCLNWMIEHKATPDAGYQPWATVEPTIKRNEEL